MPNRSRLHELVDTLPEAALNVAQGALENWQTWPPQEPPQARAAREARLQKMRRGIRPGTGGGGGGGGSHNLGPGGRIEYGHQSHSHWDGDTVVIETHRLHAGHESVSRNGCAWRMTARNSCTSTLSAGWTERRMPARLGAT